MKKLINFFKQRWIISLLGILALCLFIWFLGPFFAFADYQPLAPQTNRFVLISLIIIIWLVIQIVSFIKKMRLKMASITGDNTVFPEHLRIIQRFYEIR